MGGSLPRVLIATHPFAEGDDTPLRLLRELPLELVRNPHGRVLRRTELKELLQGVVAVIASTERYDREVLAAALDLKLIARTGVGLDGIDFAATREQGVSVAWTPDGPSDSVAELTVGLMVSLSRHVVSADRVIRAGDWQRRVGWLLAARTVGILGLGRCGSRVARLLRPFGCRLLAHDIDPAVSSRAGTLGVELVEFDQLLREADLLTLHVPLTEVTRGLFSGPVFSRMRPGALLINTARGAVVDEEALLAALEQGHLGGAALDVYAAEPYRGPLATREDVILTAHMGSCSDEGRKAMELGAAQAVCAWFKGEEIPSLV